MRALAEKTARDPQARRKAERAALRDLAQRNIERDALRRWWCDKYRLPPQDPRFLGASEAELLVELMEDRIVAGDDEDAHEARLVAGDDGHDVLVYDDPVLDALERDLRAELERVRASGGIDRG